jgi:hypothetical protein
LTDIIGKKTVVIRRRFEVITPQHLDKVAEALSDLKLHIDWLKYIMDASQVIDENNAEAVLIISGGRYPVKIKFSKWKSEKEYVLQLTFTGTFHMILTYTILPIRAGTKIRGDLEISVGFFWERLLKGFAKDLAEDLRMKIFNYMKILKEEKPPSRPEAKPKVEEKPAPPPKVKPEKPAPKPPPKPVPKEKVKLFKIPTEKEPKKLGDELLLLEIITRSELISTEKVKSLDEFFKKVESTVNTTKEKKLYILLKGKVAIRLLIEDGIITGVQVETEGKVLNGSEALKILATKPDISGWVHIFKIK